MMNIGFPEMIVIAVVALLVIGPKKLPEAGRSLGHMLREFKEAISDQTNEADGVGKHPHDPPA